MSAAADRIPETLLERRYRALGPHAPLFYDPPIHLVRGEGVWAHDNAGRQYLDVYNNVPVVGHCHPHVVAALTRQAGLLNVHTRYLHEAPVAYAERLLSTFAPTLDQVMFCCTGTEANELALRLARFATKAEGVLVTNCSYHGHSGQLAALTTALETPEPFPANARALSIPDLAVEPSCSLADWEQQVRDAIASLARSGIGLAALLLDASLSNEGMPRIPPGFLARAVELVREAGGLFIADEVQSGFGRTGEGMWSYSLHGVVPDLVTLGKPMGNGYPIAAVITSADMVERFGPAYFATFAGTPLAAEVGYAVLDVIERERLIDNAAQVGDYVRTGLAALKDRYPSLGAVRGAGLYFGVDIVDPFGAPDGAAAREIVNRLRDAGCLVGRIGPHGNVLKMRPPLVFSCSHADVLLEALDGVLKERLP